MSKKKMEILFLVYFVLGILNVKTVKCVLKLPFGEQSDI